MFLNVSLESFPIHIDNWAITDMGFYCGSLMGLPVIYINIESLPELVCQDLFGAKACGERDFCKIPFVKL